MKNTAGSFILAMNEENLQELRHSRLLMKSTRERNYMNVNAHDQLLILSEETNEIVGEYEVKEVRYTLDGLSIRVEPIYNAPPSSGLRVDDLTLLQLRSYSSVDHWKYMLKKKPVMKIKYEDYFLLSRRLIGY